MLASNLIGREFESAFEFFFNSVCEAWRLGPELGAWSPLCSLSACRARGLFFWYLLFFYLSLSVGVSGSVPEREHDHLFAFCRRGLVPDWENGHLFHAPPSVRGIGSTFLLSVGASSSGHFFLFFFLFTLLFSFFLF